MLAEISNNEVLKLELEYFKIRKRIDQNKDSFQLLLPELEQLIDLAIQTEQMQIAALGRYYQAEKMWNNKMLNQAIINYDKAYQLAIKIPDKEFFMKQTIVYKCGEKYYYLTDYVSALRILDEARKINNTHRPRQVIPVYNTMGLCYRVQGKLKEAEETFLEGLEVARSLNSAVWEGIFSGNLGHIYLKQGEREKGIQMLRKDFNISLEKNVKQSAGGAMIELARLSIESGDIERGSRQVDTALQVLNKNVPMRRKKALYPLWSKIEGYKGNWQLASKFLDSALIVSDSLSKLDNSLELLRLQQRLAFEESKKQILAAETREKKRKQQILFMIAALVLSTLSGLVIYSQKNKTAKAKKRSDELLLNILPENVAEELKIHGSSEARKFDNVTVLFSDFKDFTKHAESLPATEIVSLLDHSFGAFDQIVTELGLEKIKTVGDAYICVGGLPVEDEYHAEKVVNCALKMQKYMAQHPAGWQLRIGIHSGNVVAGIVGLKKFAYDIWGDTVNTAARMEQNSEPGKINISSSTYELVRANFDCHYRGKFDTKNKGSLDMNYVQGHR
jgi:class 3 adenylate cyclase/tetratricopeptide (TPR) repeat protein